MSVLILRDKPELKEKAVGLRRRGLTYSEILKEVPVAKSTLSLWFHDVGLAEHQNQRITEKRIEGQKKGAAARRAQRIKSQDEIWSASQKEIGKLTKREFWLIGVALYWAEGSKEKVGRSQTNSQVQFTNMDSRMVRVFIAWLLSCGVSRDDMIPSLFIHDTRRDCVADSIAFWSKVTGFPISSFHHVYFKKSNIRTNRKNTGDTYHGVLKIYVRKSSRLMRRIQGWTNGIFEGITI